MSVSIEHCPNCGAPLDLEERDDCRWCRARVTDDDADPFHETDAEVFLARVGLGEYDATGVQPVPSIIAVLRYAAFDAAARRFLETQAALIKELGRAVLEAGKRVRTAGATNAAAFDSGDEVYALQEWWTFDLATDFLAVLASIKGIDKALESELRTKVQFMDKKFFDKPWARDFERRPAHASVPHRQR